MSSATHVAERSAVIARILETEDDLKAFQQHVTFIGSIGDPIMAVLYRPVLLGRLNFADYIDSA